MRKPGKRTNPAAGFTLIELMVTSGLTAMILVAAYLCLQAGLTSQKMIHSRSDSVQTARAVLALMSADLRAACPLSEEFAFLGMRRTIGDTDADNIDFATLNYTPRAPGESDICEVSYFINRDPETGGFSLWRRRDAGSDGDPLAGGSREKLTGNVRGLRLEYSDGLFWYDDWGEEESLPAADSLLDSTSGTGLPAAVRITLSMESDGASGRSDDTENPAPPMVFKTVARLQLVDAPWVTGNQDALAGGMEGGLSVQ